MTHPSRVERASTALACASGAVDGDDAGSAEAVAGMVVLVAMSVPVTVAVLVVVAVAATGAVD